MFTSVGEERKVERRDVMKDAIEKMLLAAKSAYVLIKEQQDIIEDDDTEEIMGDLHDGISGLQELLIELNEIYAGLATTLASIETFQAALPSKEYLTKMREKISLTTSPGVLTVKIGEWENHNDFAPETNADRILE